MNKLFNIFSLKNIQISRTLMSRQLVFDKYGDPSSVVKIKECEVTPLDNNEVLVRMQAAPINPSDLYVIQGTYPLKLNLPCIAGNEGVGIVEEVGNDVKNIKPGNKVVVTKQPYGTWRDFAKFNKNVLKVIPNEIRDIEASMLIVNPCSAYRMLSDFLENKENSVIIQNGSNSACGQNVIQLCKAWGIKSINIIRKRQNTEELKKYLLSLGANYVLTEEELDTTSIFKDNLIDRPSLALDCVGGQSALKLISSLKTAGKIVTYGAISYKPISISPSQFIFKNINCNGFWLMRWYETVNPSKIDGMIEDLVLLMLQNKLKAPLHKKVKLDNYKETFGLCLQDFIGQKYIFDLTSGEYSA